MTVVRLNAEPRYRTTSPGASARSAPNHSDMILVPPRYPRVRVYNQTVGAFGEPKPSKHQPRGICALEAFLFRSSLRHGHFLAFALQQFWLTLANTQT